MSAAPVITQILKMKLKIVAGPHMNELYILDKAVTKIGRGEDNDIKLINDGRMSRYHAEIYFQDDQLRFRNISQKNFVLLEGQVVEEGLLQAGTKLQMGETTFEVFSDAPVVVSSEMTVKVDSPIAPSQKPMILQKTPDVSAAAQAPVKKPSLAKPKPQVKIQQQQPQFQRPQTSGSNGRLYLYGTVIAVLFGVYYLATSDSKKDVKTFRTSQQVEYDLLQSSDEKKRLQERLDTMQSAGAQRSQENLIKGFRDFQQGNFARARDNFQVVLNLDPDNAIAKRYYHLARIKFDELLQFHMLQGLRYRDKKNYRLCRSSFQSALVMIQNNQQHPKYREIKNFFDECNLALEGRY